MRLEVDAYPGRMFEGKITTIEPQIATDTRNIRVQATIANPDEILKPGMFVTTTVVLPDKPAGRHRAGNRGRLHALRRLRVRDHREEGGGRQDQPDRGAHLRADRQPGRRPCRNLKGLKPGDKGRRRRPAQAAIGRCGRDLDRSAAADPGAAAALLPTTTPRASSLARLALCPRHKNRDRRDGLNRYLHQTPGAVGRGQPADPADRPARGDRPADPAISEAVEHGRSTSRPPIPARPRI